MGSTLHLGGARHFKGTLFIKQKGLQNLGAFPGFLRLGCAIQRRHIVLYRKSEIFYKTTHYIRQLINLVSMQEKKIAKVLAKYREPKSDPKSELRKTVVDSTFIFIFHLTIFIHRKFIQLTKYNKSTRPTYRNYLPSNNMNLI